MIFINSIFFLFLDIFIQVRDFQIILLHVIFYAGIRIFRIFEGLWHFCYLFLQFQVLNSRVRIFWIFLSFLSNRVFHVFLIRSLLIFGLLHFSIQIINLALIKSNNFVIPAVFARVVIKRKSPRFSDFNLDSVICIVGWRRWMALHSLHGLCLTHFNSFIVVIIFHLIGSRKMSLGNGNNRKWRHWRPRRKRKSSRMPF